jgi:phage terminase large subunit-like protein
MSNACVDRDKADNVMLSKSKSTEKIDPAQALVNAIAGAMDGHAELAKQPVYDENPKIIWVR